MSHEIDMTTGRAAMAYVGELPWHGLGAKLTAGAPLEEWQAEAGLDWEAVKSPVQFDRKAIGTDGQPVMTRATDPNSFVVYRSDCGSPLSVVSDRYQLVQPRDIIEFYRDLTERHGFVLETAGALKGGRKIWALANTHDAIVLPGQDRVNGYLLLATSFDGSMATQARFTSIRVVCNNTLTAAVRGRAEVNVTHSAKFDPGQAKITLQVGDAWAKFSETARQMAETEIKPTDVARLLLEAYQGLGNDAAIATAKEDPRKSEAIEKFIGRMGATLQGAPGANLASSRGTVWGLINAVTYDIDHQARAHNQDNRLNSAWFGKGETIKNKIFEIGQRYLAETA